MKTRRTIEPAETLEEENEIEARKEQVERTETVSYLTGTH